MALGTIRLAGFPFELVVVIVCMTIHAQIVFQRIGEICLMALFTINGLVPAEQWIPGLVMIEVIHAFDDVKGFLIMALPAVQPKLSFVHIGMATGATVKNYAFKFAEFPAIFGDSFMAFSAFNQGMLAGQGKQRPVVVEFVGRFKLVETMTIIAFTGKGPLVVIFMTACTGWIQSKISVFFGFNFRI